MAVAEQALVESLAERISETLMARADANHKYFLDEYGFRKVLAESAFESELEKLAGEVPGELYDVVWRFPTIRETLDEMKLVVEEAARDEMEYHKAMTGSVYQQLRYVGMSIHDFI